MGFKIRDMWYNLGECFAPADNAAGHARGTRHYFFIVQFQCMVVFFSGALLDSSVWREVKRQHIAFANQTIIFLCDNVLLSLRPTQIEVYPGHGGAHSGGHAGA